MPPPLRALVVALGVFAFHSALVAFFGTSVAGDSWGQWHGEALAGRFRDWHPFMHTAGMWLVAKVWPSYTFAVFVQIAAFSFACAFMHDALRRVGANGRLACASVAAVAAHPASLYMLRDLGKDAMFAVACLVALSSALRLAAADAGGKRRTAALFAASVVYASFVRHNGIFFTIPLLAVLPFLFPSRSGGRKGAALSLICAALVCAYAALRSALVAHGVVRDCPDQRFAESVGVPMAVMESCYVRDPERTPPAAVQFLERIFPRKTWVRFYECGNFEAVKFCDMTPSASDPDFGVSQWRFMRGLCDNVTPGEFMRIVADTVRTNPRRALVASLCATQVGWDAFLHPSKGGCTPPDGQATRFTAGLDAFVDAVFHSPPGFAFGAGFALLCYMFFGGWGLAGHRRTALLSLPFITYGLGTTLFLTGGNSYRFFYGNVLCLVPFVCAVLADGSRKC